MCPDPIPVSLRTARRLAVTKQHLAGTPPSRATRADILSVVRDLAYVQWDPISIVAPSHLLALWSRLGSFRTSDLERLLWEDRTLFLHWTPIASIVLTEDYPIYASLMRRYPDSLSDSWGSQRAQAKRFLADRSALRRTILRALRTGPKRIGDFRDHPRTQRNDGEWTPGSDVALMLSHLAMSGDVMVVGHDGNQNLWGLPGPFLPKSARRPALPASDFEKEAAQRAIRALGTATPREITMYFVRGRYLRLDRTLQALADDSRIHRVQLLEAGKREQRYVHSEDLPLLDQLADDRFRPRTTLIPPFDNLIGNHARTRLLFGFDYVREQFLPPARRRFGTYVLPILCGDRLIGRIDAHLDRATGVLGIDSVHAEPGAPAEREAAVGIARAIHELAEFLGARTVTFGPRAPPAWRSALR